MRNERRRNTTFNASAALHRTQDMHVAESATVMQDTISLSRHIDPMPFVPKEGPERDRRCQDIFSIQCDGLAKRIVHTNCETVVLGISGGLDSTLALLVCAKTFDRLQKS